jgi:2,4-dienoyl-CoA reductase-like NADH-dependent reductase (Old Yellow Enzyme family)
LVADKQIALDFVEISGGCYEESVMMTGPSSRDREAYFAKFAEKARSIVNASNACTDANGGKKKAVAFMLTGGFRSAPTMQDCLHRGIVDIIGMGRPFVMQPDRVKDLLRFSANNDTNSLKEFVFKDANLKTGVKEQEAGKYRLPQNLRRVSRKVL